MQFLILAANKFGVLSRITSIVSSLGANIETVAVYPLQNSELSVVQITAEGSETQRARLLRKLTRLVDVVECSSDTGEGFAALQHATEIKYEVAACTQAKVGDEFPA